MVASAWGRVDNLTLTIYGTDNGHNQVDTVRDLYVEIYAEPPYNEGPEEVEDFLLLAGPGE